MVDVIEYKGEIYPKFQSEGFASQFAFPFAQKVCKGFGYDIGCNRKEWALPNSMPIDISFDDGYNALKLPIENVDYIFSSHCLEHITNWVDVLDYWYGILKNKGVLFLYLPDFSQKYWRPWHNRKHVNSFTPEIIKQYLIDKGYKKVFVSGIDLNSSFIAIGEK